MLVLFCNGVMFLRVNRNARGAEYLQIVRSYRDNGKVKQQILFTLGRLDLLQASGEIDGLVKALAWPRRYATSAPARSRSRMA
jgi:hypothetical protein